MNKTTQMWLGVAVLGVAGYLLWKKSQEKKEKSFANMSGADKAFLEPKTKTTNF